MDTCRVCGNTAENERFIAREMMFGSRDEFHYFECDVCGCVQIAEVPEDLGSYYPEGYYAFEPVLPKEKGALKRWLRRQWASSSLGSRNPIGWLLTGRYGRWELLQWMRHARVSLDNAILDVGCGAGVHLVEMRAAGFSNLTGMDPYIPADITYPNGVRILRRTLEQTEGEYDLVMLNHSFEHMADPLLALHEIRRLLRPEGCLLIRIPVADCHAWRTYGPDWVQLDPPRHLFVHTRRSMQHLAEAARLTISDVIYDSNAFQFWGSEQYRRDIPLHDARSYLMSPAASPFTAEEIRRFEQAAAALNQTGEGDQACFYLRKRTS